MLARPLVWNFRMNARPWERTRQAPRHANRPGIANRNTKCAELPRSKLDARGSLTREPLLRLRIPKRNGGGVVACCFIDTRFSLNRPSHARQSSTGTHGLNGTFSLQIVPVQASMTLKSLTYRD